MAKKKTEAPPEPEAPLKFVVRTFTGGESYQPGDDVPEGLDIEALEANGNISRAGSIDTTLQRGNWRGTSHIYDGVYSESDAAGRPTR